MMGWLIAAAVLLHPGHTTQLEIRFSDDAKSLEIAMRMDSADLEAALKARHQKSIDVQTLSIDDAKLFIGGYLQTTLLLGGEKLKPDEFRWIGWQRETRHLWVYFELPMSGVRDDVLKLQIKTLFEIEPELQHVVELGDNAGKRTEIVSDSEKVIRISRILDR